MSVIKRYRHVITILVLTYLMILLVSGFIEAIYIQQNARELSNLIETAASMAIDQTQVTDDFFKPEDAFVADKLGTDQHTDFKIKIITESGTIEEVNLFDKFVGQPNLTKADIYNHLYTRQSSNFRRELGGSGSKSNKTNYLTTSEITKVKFPYFQYEPTSGGVEVYYEPSVLQLGIGGPGSDRQVRQEFLDTITQTGGTISSSSTFDVNTSILDDFKTEFESFIVNPLNNTTKKGYELLAPTKLSTYVDPSTKEIEIEDYFLTPLALGITYLDEELLQQMFINNLELLMRAKYIDGGLIKLNSDGEQMGAGIYKGATYAQDVVGLQGMDNEFINNGRFSVKVGPTVSGSGVNNTLHDGSMDNNGSVKIDYKVVDMYDNTNKPILKQTLGVLPNNAFTDVGVSPGDYGGYYKKIDELNLRETVTGGPATQAQPNEKPMVVAKITFYIDTIIPYHTMTMRELRAYNRNDVTSGIAGRNLLNYDDTTIRNHTANNYLDLRPREMTLDSNYNINITDNRDNTHNGLRRMEYTTLFAVAP